MHFVPNCDSREQTSISSWQAGTTPTHLSSLYFNTSVLSLPEMRERIVCGWFRNSRSEELSRTCMPLHLSRAGSVTSKTPVICAWAFPLTCRVVIWDWKLIPLSTVVKSELSVCCCCIHACIEVTKITKLSRYLENKLGHFCASSNKK